MGFKLIEKRSHCICRGFFEPVITDDGNGRFFVENGVTFRTLSPVDDMSLSSQLKAGANLKRVPTTILKSGIEKIQEFSDSYNSVQVKPEPTNSASNTKE